MNDLFEPIEVISDRPTQNEIDSAVAEYPQYDKNYVWAGIRSDIRDNMNSRWNAIKAFCESDFSSEFRQIDQHHSRLWELNCRYLLKDKLLRTPRPGEPDIIAKDFVIECTVPMPTGVPELHYDGRLFDFPTDQISRRVTSVLVEKLAQFERRLANTNASINYENTPYIIGIALTHPNFLSSMHMNGMDIPEAVLMGAGPLQITINGDGSQGKMSIATQHSITASGGAEIPTAFFQRDEWKKVSAVLWSTKWFPEENDIKVLLNPNANIRFNPDNLGINAVVISYTKVREGYNRDQRLN